MICEDVSFIKAPARWPAYPLLPLKRYVNNDLECGFIYEPHVNRIYVGYIFANVNETIKNGKSYQYDSVEAIVADGWMVD